MRHQNLFFQKEKTYYIDENGEMVTGWKDIDNFRYFFDENGEMSIGWKETKEGTYYFQEDGKMSVGWQKIGEDTYYFDKEGKMADRKAESISVGLRIWQRWEITVKGEQGGSGETDGCVDI